MQGMLALLHKGGDKELLGNWQPIALLNVCYKIYAKALQKRLQPILSEVISADQTAFLPLRFILNNVLLLDETVHWAKQSKQDIVLLKLDFMKAYDRISWEFLFSAMAAMGFGEGFIHLVQLLFRNVSSSVYLNGSQTAGFEISKGVRQGCPLAPYLFLLVGEALNIYLQQVGTAGRIKGVWLLGG